MEPLRHLLHHPAHRSLRRKHLAAATIRPKKPKPPAAKAAAQGLFAPELMKAALKQSFVMLRPDIQWKNPVMFVVEVGTVLSIIFTIRAMWVTAARRASAI